VPLSKEADNITSRDHDNRMLILLDLAIRLQIDVTRRDHIPNYGRNRQMRRDIFADADAVFESAALCVQGKVNKDPCDPVTKAHLPKSRLDRRPVNDASSRTLRFQAESAGQRGSALLKIVARLPKSWWTSRMTTKSSVLEGMWASLQ
jgi:hypothetical protein